MTGKPELSIPARDLDAAGKAYAFALRTSWLRGALEGTEVRAGEPDGKLELRASRSGTDVVVHGALEARVLVPCARCLEPVHVTVAEPLSVLAVPGEVPAKHDAADSDDDAPPEQEDILLFDGETVILDDLVRDTILLGIPMVPLCSEACPGISPEKPLETAQPAAAKQTDPRLQPLLHLSKKSTP